MKVIPLSSIFIFLYLNLNLIEKLFQLKARNPLQLKHGNFYFICSKQMESNLLSRKKLIK